VRGESLQPFWRPVRKPCIRHTEGMNFRGLPTTEVVIRDGQPVWRVCGQGVCVEDRSGTQALAAYNALCQAQGKPTTGCSGNAPCRGPCEVDEPGV
jgi:hypothetical protein